MTKPISTLRSDALKTCHASLCVSQRCASRRGSQSRRAGGCGRHAVLLLFERDHRVFAGAFDDVDALVCYALKANSNQAVVATLARLGAGADVVSGGELLRARAAGVPPQRIVFSGVGKTGDELALAVDHGILCINVESESELDLLASIAVAKGRRADISIRVNPDVDPKTH